MILQIAHIKTKLKLDIKSITTDKC
jgi:hypothetical protein